MRSLNRCDSDLSTYRKSMMKRNVSTGGLHSSISPTCVLAEAIVAPGAQHGSAWNRAEGVAVVLDRGFGLLWDRSERPSGTLANVEI
jgi:hypothetical protein